MLFALPVPTILAVANPKQMKDHLHKSNQNSAFTLIELLLYTSLMTATLLALIPVLQTFLAARIKNQTVAEIEQQGLQAIQLITQTIRNADAINSPATGVSAASLSLDMVGISLDPTVFDLSSSTLRIQEAASSPVSLTSSSITTSSLSFYNLTRASTPGTIRIQFTLTYVNPTGRNEYNYSKTFYATATLR